MGSKYYFSNDVTTTQATLTTAGATNFILLPASALTAANLGVKNFTGYTDTFHRQRIRHPPPPAAISSGARTEAPTPPTPREA